MHDLMKEVIEDKNKEARRTNPCINKKCNNFVEIGNKYDICIDCFDMVVEEMQSIHRVFDYGTKPTTGRMTSDEMKNLLKEIERKPRVKIQNIKSSNRQKGVNNGK